MCCECATLRQAPNGAPPVDLVVLDLMLPDIDGLEVCRRIRALGGALGHTPVLMLTAKGDPMDRIVGLELGADDYLPKPFSLEELLARVRSLMRRQATTKETVLEHRGIRVDLLARTVTQNGTPVEMTSREFALLEVFLQNTGRVLPRTLICEKIWESHYDVDTNLLDVYMSKLRTKLEADSAKPLFKTVRGVGYQML